MASRRDGDCVTSTSSRHPLVEAGAKEAGDEGIGAQTNLKEVDHGKGKEADRDGEVTPSGEQPTFQALERSRWRTPGWPELTLRGTSKPSARPARRLSDCRQVEAELRGEIPAGPAEPPGAVAAPAEPVAEVTEPGEESVAPATEEMPPAEAPALPASTEEPQKLVAAVVTCKGCQGRMTRGTMVVKRRGIIPPQVPSQR